jgi:formate-dependent nitrite reductase membrane component NrfD
MFEDLSWGLPVIGYLFLAGLGAGALTVSASVLLRGGKGGFGGKHFAIARYGALIAPPTTGLGILLLIFELGSFEAGNWLRFLNLYTVLNLSPMSIGTWLLTIFLIIASLYAYTFVRPGAAANDDMEGKRRALAWMSVPLGIAVAVYTGVLLGAMPARPFWNSPVLAFLFLMSSLSTGVAAIMLARTLFGDGPETEGSEAKSEESNYLLTTSDMLLIGFELMAIFLFLMFAQITVGDVKHAVSILLSGGSVAFLFWVGVVFVGLILPGLIELRYTSRRLLYHGQFAAPPRSVELMVPVAVLIGGFVLRLVIVVAGQATGPIGI